ncbi:hypothetical protein DPMN_008616 [Dreissena polymorpha]|uniref:G-protein coupled receptors family 1 profile domain-containing protein n=1 Tax=Dreissena polymorpha TaxID=45954 RepID=A0A9D4MVG2_DREPO|nr:hypothetical protein DPMN_008616 [Dreissena polymorpha]
MEENASTEVYQYPNNSNASGPMNMHTMHIHFIDIYVIPVFSLLGCVLNVVTAVCLSKQPFNSCSSSVYLRAYSICSALAWLFLVGLVPWIIDLTGSRYIQLISDSSCRIWLFVEKVVMNSPFWFIAGSTLDRLVALWCPQRTQSMCSVFMAKAMIALILVVVVAVGVHVMWTAYLHSGECVRFNVEVYNQRVGMYILTGVLCYLPLVCVFIFGNLLIVRLCLKHRGTVIQNANNIDYDMNCIVAINALVVFMSAAPFYILTIISIVVPEPIMLIQIFIYFGLLCYFPLFPTMFLKCKEFRDVLLQLIKQTTSCLRRSNSSIELRLMNGEYNSVPSTSTSV